tara:strand:+ start:7949 stop:8188 length:240 start_codon:yes stop_codon:yes gene_type:complete
MLGKKVKSIITGFEGIATAKIEYINGCVQYCVKPKCDKNGLMPEGHYIDVEELEITGKGKRVIPTATGGANKEIPTSRH